MDDSKLTLIDIIVDHPKHISLYDISQVLKRARIFGQDILHVLVKDPNLHPKNEFDIPHVGHSMMYCADANLCEKARKPWRYTRNLNLQLVVEGQIDFVNQRHTNFELQHGVVIMVSTVFPVPPVSEHARFNLDRVWKPNKEKSNG